MFINILPDVKIKTIKIYFLKPVDRKIVNDIFDKLHVQKRMEFTIQPTFYGYPIFRCLENDTKKPKKKCGNKHPWF